MKHNALIILAGFSVLALAGACEAPQDSGDGNANVERSIEGASVSKAVTNIEKDGKTISFTITDDARKFDDAAQGTTSAIYDSAKDDLGDCPKVSSSKVSKDIIDYDAMSGHADIKATFDDQSDADAVFDAGCLIIDDQ